MASAPQTLHPEGNSAKLQFPMEIAFDTLMQHSPSADTAAVVTLSADAAKKNVIGQIHCSYSAAPAAGSTIKVEDGATTVYLQYVGAGLTVITFNPPLCGSVNAALTITLAAPGGAVVGKVYVNAWKLLG